MCFCQIDRKSPRVLRFLAAFFHVNKYCAVACSCKGIKKRPDLDYFRFPMKSDDRKKWEVFCKRSAKKFKRLIDPRICMLHFWDDNIGISISGRKNIPSGYMTIFDLAKVKNTTSAHPMYLTIIPRARMGYESIAHVGKRNNCMNIM